MSELREVRAKARREGYTARFFERGGQVRLDFFRREKLKLPDYFEALAKIVFRGRDGGRKEKLMGVILMLYIEGVVRTGEKLKISKGIFVEGAYEELRGVSARLARIYGEKNLIENEIEVIDEKESTEQRFEGVKREELQGMSAEEWFYEKILVPEVEENGGRREGIIPQIEVKSLIPEEDESERRVDFFLTGSEGKGVVIEVDDGTHRKKTEKDEERDKLMRTNKLRVYRVRDSELFDVEQARKRLRKTFDGFYEKNGSGNAVMVKNGSECEKKGFNGKILVGEEGENEVLVQEVEFLWSILSYKAREKVEICKFSVTETTKEDFSWLLEYIFGFKEFKEGQFEAIERILRREDAIVLLPTGSGKSVIYQLLALVLPGVGIVVEPLRALMEDQVANLERRGIQTAVNLSEGGTQRQKERVLKQVEEGVFSLIYITPERMQMNEFRKRIERAKSNGVRFWFLAVDEAHCISEWGHDFRVPYLNLAETGRKLLKTNGVEPKILALTGTASDNVLRDMERDIGIPEDGVIQPRTFDRPEIHFRVISVGSAEKLSKLEELILKMKEDFPEMSEDEIRGVVFCVFKTGGSDFGVEGVCRRFVETFGEEHIARYYGSDEKAKMRENMRRFKEDEAEIMVATKAFGMGIDKGNIRYTIHYGITNSIEAYYQEAGRAGRDGRKAMSYILLSNDYPERNDEMLRRMPISEMKRELKIRNESARDDVNRVLFLHQKHFDKEAVIRTTKRLIEKLGRFSVEKAEEKMLVAKNKIEFEDFQRVLYRLKILGVINDYTIFDYANNEFLVLNKKFNPVEIMISYGEYVARYQEGQKRHEMNKIKRQTYRNQEEFILTLMGILLDFTDEVFEKSRRRAILNMLELAEAGAKIKNLDEQDKEIRRRIINYLGAENQELLKRILLDKKFIQEAAEAIYRVRKKDEMGLLAEAKRQLESFPEHPGLLITVGALEMVDEETEAKKAVGDFFKVREVAHKYGIQKHELFKTTKKILKDLFPKARDEEKFRREIEMIERELREEWTEFGEEMIEVLPERFTYLFQGRKLISHVVLSLNEVEYGKRDLWKGE